jgi:hypothetical protein
MAGFGDPLEGSVERTFPQTGSEGKATGRTQRPLTTHHPPRINCNDDECAMLLFHRNTH